MSLEKGQKLGPYEIEAPIGAGGIGEVYRARDTRLDRVVAIKILHTGMAMNAEMRARFEREAKAISSLNHPNICTLYDIGHEAGIDYIVIEFLEGETLADRLKKGALDIIEALNYATQIADALDAAHSNGLVHRDLKPGNVMLTREGAKLLDFGLAKIQISEDMAKKADGATHTAPLTGKGTIIGTLNYMSPEQLEAKEADTRSDIFAFGAMLYEMLTGQRAFEGHSQASLIAAIMEREPVPPSEIKPMTPPALNRLVRKCLAKDPDQRWQSTKDLADELRWIAQSGSQAGLPSLVSARRKIRFRLAWIIAILAIISTVILGTLWFSRKVPEPRIRRFTFIPKENFSAISWPMISPDGNYLAFLARDSSDITMIWVRPLNSLESYKLAGTENTHRHFWSPDSKYLAFVVGNRQLKKVSITGGPIQLIGEVDNSYDGTWGNDGIILLDGSMTDSIRQIPASGGRPSAATQIERDSGETYHMWPEFLPDGRHFIYLTEYSADSSLSILDRKRSVKIGSLDSYESKILFEADSRVQYCPQGYILYAKDGILLAQPFDAKSMKVTGDPIPLAQNLARRGPMAEEFSVSDEGTLVINQTLGEQKSKLIWVDRQGNELETVGPPNTYGEVALSPDDDRIAYTLMNPDSQTYDIWVHDLRRNVDSRLTFDRKSELCPIWTPDGKDIIYTSFEFIPYACPMRRAANGTGVATAILGSDVSDKFAFDISPDGEILYYDKIKDMGLDLESQKIDSTAEPVIIEATPFNETFSRISPNERFLAYCSDESEQLEVYVRQLDGAGGRWQISTEGGDRPMWRADGKELFYRGPDNSIMSVPIDYKNGFEVGMPVKLFERKLCEQDLNIYNYDVSVDGQRFLLNVPLEEDREQSFIIIQDWHKEIGR